MGVTGVIISLLWGVFLFIVLTFLMRYNRKAFYIAQCIYGGLWAFSHLESSLFDLFNSVFALWVIASLAALSMDKLPSSQPSEPELDKEKLEAFAAQHGFRPDAIEEDEAIHE